MIELQKKNSKNYYLWDNKLYRYDIYFDRRKIAFIFIDFQHVFKKSQKGWFAFPKFTPGDGNKSKHT